MNKSAPELRNARLMGSTASSLLLAVISAAVTPVVLISACAALLVSVNAKQTTLSSQIRELAAEWRDHATGTARRENVAAQLRCLSMRFRHAARSQLWLHASVVCFIFTVFSLTIAHHLSRSERWDRPTLSLFELGIALMLGAGLEQLLETWRARATISLELEEIFPQGRNSIGETARPGAGEG